MRTFVMGDIHGAHRAMIQSLQRCGFDYENDVLIQIGDIVDGRWPDVFECIEELLKIKKLIAIRGNHDQWFLDYCMSGTHPVQWKMGGDSTAKSYLRQMGKEDLFIPGVMASINPGDVPDAHLDLLKKQHYYYEDEKNRCFVHGGFDQFEAIGQQHPHVLYWDRGLWYKAIALKGDEMIPHMDDFSEIFIGHTATTFWKTT